MLMQNLPISHAAKVGTLELHSQVGGIVVLLQESALSKQFAASKQEQGGWFGIAVMLMHDLPVSHGAMEGKFPVHWQSCGELPLLQVSELSSQSAVSRQEHGGCPAYCANVRLRHVLNSSHDAFDGRLKLHSHPGGFNALLQVSAHP